MVDLDQSLGHEVQTVLQQQVVRLVDLPGLGVVERHETEVHPTHLDRLEDLPDRRIRAELGSREQPQGPLLGVSTGLALVSNDRVHGRHDAL